MLYQALEEGRLPLQRWKTSWWWILIMSWCWKSCLCCQFIVICLFHFLWQLWCGQAMVYSKLSGIRFLQKSNGEKKYHKRRFSGGSYAFHKELFILLTIRDVAVTCGNCHLRVRAGTDIFHCTLDTHDVECWGHFQLLFVISNCIVPKPFMIYELSSILSRAHTYSHRTVASVIHDNFDEVYHTYFYELKSPK